MKLPFPIIDPHIHHWDILNTPRRLTPVKRILGGCPRLYESMVAFGAPAAERNYLGGWAPFLNDYLPETYRADAEGLPIEKVIHVEADWRHKRGLGPVGETRWLSALYRDNPKTLGAIVGYVPLHHANAEQVIEAHIEASPKFVGVRQMLSYEFDKGVMHFADKPELSSDPNWHKGLTLLEKYQLSFEAWGFHHQLGELNRIIKSYPGVEFMLDHMGTPIGLAGPFASWGHSVEMRAATLRNWQLGLSMIAQNPNVHVKLSGFFMPVVGWGYEHRSAEPSVDELLEKAGPLFEFVIETFGVDRCLFASNFPMDKVSLSLARLYEFYFKLSEPFGLDQQRKLFFDNARRFYKMDSHSSVNP